MNYSQERGASKMAKKLEGAGLRGQVAGETSDAFNQQNGCYHAIDCDLLV